jgi:tetratricopeptide (TPR) repeat protein
MEALELSKEIYLTTETWWVLILLGDLAIHTRAFDEARQWFEACLAFAQEHDIPRALFDAFERLGSISRHLLAYEDVHRYYERAIEFAQKHRDRAELSRALAQRGHFDLFLGRFKQAVDYLSQAVAVLQDDYEVTNVDYIFSLALAYCLSGDFKMAQSIFEDAQKGVREFDHRSRIASILFFAEYQTMIGQYNQAILNMNRLVDLFQDTYVEDFFNGRREMVLGWLALVAEDYTKALIHFNQSIEHNKTVVYSTEWIAWAQAGLVASYLFQDQREDAYLTLRQALKTTINIQGFIPLLFTLPFACYCLAQEHPDLAGEVYTQIQTSPFLANAQFFEDTVYRHLPDEIKQSKREEASYFSESELIENLWKTASKIMALWETE